MSSALVFNEILNLNQVAINYENGGDYGQAIITYCKLSCYLYELLNRLSALNILTNNIYNMIDLILSKVDNRCHMLSDLTKYGQHLGVIQELFTNISPMFTTTKIAGLTAVEPHQHATFNHIIGHDRVKIQIQDVLDILTTTNPIIEELKNEMSVTNNNILFYGPSGTGKTSLANAISHQLQWPMYIIKMGNLFSDYVGQTEKRLEEIFTWLMSQKKLIVFIDEIESLIGERQPKEENFETRIKDILLSSMDTLKRQKNDIIIIGATNLLEFVDNAFRNRFSYIINIPLPNSQEILQLFHFYMKKIPYSLDSTALSQLFGGRDNVFLSHFDIANLCKKYHFQFLNYIQAQVQNNQIKIEQLSGDIDCYNYKHEIINSSLQLGGDNQYIPFEKKMFEKICVDFNKSSADIITDLKALIQQKRYGLG
jgi:AAA+ superfamily predicted ATPase